MPYAVGDTLDGPVRGITRERIEWYDSAMLSAAIGELAQVGSNIHTDDDYARQEGFPGVIADGMIMANWCSEMMVRHFGLDYLERGELRTKFIRPVLLGVELRVKGRITAAGPGLRGGTLYNVAIWCEDEYGMKLTDGDAKVEVA
jgi:acyl dehydratase